LIEEHPMSTVDQPKIETLPPLVDGQRLAQPTFHERYEAMPPDTWAELVGGIVYMPSPLRGEHGGIDDSVSYWIGHYKRFTKRLASGKNVTTILGESGECQPDGQLRIPEALGGQTQIVEGYVTGAPELIIEIARSSRKYDLGAKKADYERAGVLEYLVVELDPDRTHWFIRRDGHFEDLSPGADGIFRSEAFPGLWLEPQALYDDDLGRLAQVVDQGLATPEHAAFVARLAQAKEGRVPG
jgi:Uma2 family endonuclease